MDLLEVTGRLFSYWHEINVEIDDESCFVWLQEHKAKVLQLEQQVAKVKTRYSIALRNLEQISEQIHAQRGRDPGEGGGRPSICVGRSPPVGAESDIKVQAEGGACGGAIGRDGVDASIDLLERYKEKEHEKERERAGSDSLSVFSLQTIASDLEKYDSVEHLGNLSDVGSITGDEGEKEKTGVTNKRDKLVETSAKERQQQFYKQHHRSFSLWGCHRNSCCKQCKNKNSNPH